MADLSALLERVAFAPGSTGLLAPAQAASFDNPPWDDATSRFLVLRLSPWRDMDRSTSHLFLHSLLRSNAGPGAFVDFAFFPSRADRAALRAAGAPPLFGIVSRREARDFDAVLVSVSYALELPNLPRLLLDSSIPLRSSERREAGGYPLLLAGGSNALAVQAWIFDDGDAFVDGVFFGEGEEGGAALVEALLGSSGQPITDRLERIRRAVPAFWAADPGGGTGAPGSVQVARHRGGQGIHVPVSYPLLNTPEAGSARLRISLGCPAFCTFCFEGWERKPYRELPRNLLLAAARELKARSGATDLELDSFNFNAHSDVVPLVEELNGIFDRVSLMSQRADLLVGIPGLLRLELAAEKRSYTIGVEGISGAMRAYYGKGLPDATLIAVLERLARERIREIKLFYILSGRETPGDLQEFHRFCKELKELRAQRNPSLRIIFSFGYLVRMPFTPLRYEALVLDRNEFSAREAEIKKSVETHGFEFRLAATWDQYLADQLLVAGSHALAEGLRRAAEGGAAFDLGIEGPLVEELLRALRESGELVPGAQGRLEGPLADEKTPDYPFALAFLKSAVGGAVLYRRFLAAREGRQEEPCFADFAAAEAGGSCSACGACADEKQRTFLTGHRIDDDGRGAASERLGALISLKRRSKPRWALVHLAGSWSGAVPELQRAALLRTALAAGWRDETLPHGVSGGRAGSGYRAGAGGIPADGSAAAWTRGDYADLSGRLFRIEEAGRADPALRLPLPPGATGAMVVALYGIGGEDPAGDPQLDDEAYAAALAALAAGSGQPSEALDTFSPEDAAGVELELTVRMTSRDERDAVGAVRTWLGDLKLAYTERKAAGGRDFDMAPKDRKKRSVLAATLRREDESKRLSWVLRIRGGRRLDLSGLYRAAGRDTIGVEIDRLGGPFEQRIKERFHP